VNPPSLSAHEEKLLLCLLLFYREVGPAATPGLSGLDEEAGLERHELEEAVKALREKGLIEYWALQPAVRLTETGLRLATRIDGDGRG
jgi:Mn-dependent DtxR family transcriptional regulator